MNKLTIFENNEFGKIRTISISGQPYIMLNDICEVLEIKNPRDAKTRLSEKGVVTTDILTDGGEQKSYFY